MQLLHLSAKSSRIQHLAYGVQPAEWEVVLCLVWHRLLLLMRMGWTGTCVASRVTKGLRDGCGVKLVNEPRAASLDYSSHASF